MPAVMRTRRPTRITSEATGRLPEKITKTRKQVEARARAIKRATPRMYFSPRRWAFLLIVVPRVAW